MSNRLEKIAALIPDGLGVADVGTDHGYIPIMLCRRGYPGAIVAADINEEPLKKAVAAAGEADFSDRIKFLQCDGLSGVAPMSVDTIVIAGMGGDTITGILDRDYWCADGRHTLILQPMSHQNVLRYWLVHNEFRITLETLVRDSGTIYQLFTAEAGTAPEYSDAELFTGKYEQICGDPLFNDFLDGLIKQFSAAIRGMENGGEAVRGRTELNLGVLRGLLRMKERMQNG